MKPTHCGYGIWLFNRNTLSLSSEMLFRLIGAAIWHWMKQSGVYIGQT